ncbi:MAG: PP2C family protein-serine/threonine phosphatase [Chloroflexota bacterium]
MPTISTSTTQESQSKLYRALVKIASVFYPNLRDLIPERQVVSTGDVISFLYALPLATAGLIWLITITNFTWLTTNLGITIFFAVLILIFNQLRFFMIVELRDNRFGSADGSLTNIPIWSGVLLFGPIIFWIPVLTTIVRFFLEWGQVRSSTARWGQLRNTVFGITSETLIPVAAFRFYQMIGGEFPFNSLTIQTIALALIMFGVYAILYTLFWAGYLVYSAWAQQMITGKNRIQPIVNFFLLAVGLPQITNPFAILAAGLYADNNILIYLFFLSGMLVVAYLSRRLSWSTEHSRQHSQMLKKLEQLGRAIINAPPDIENLPNILEENIRNMFPAGRLVCWIFPEDILLKYPVDWSPELDLLWPWLLNREKGEFFLGRDSLPWQEKNIRHNPIVIAPIQDMKASQTFGGIYLELHTLAQPWNRRALENLCPAMQSLAAQISSAFNQAQVYQQALDFQRVSEELKVAGNIQSSLLPNNLPNMPGWQLAVTLAPASETSGDFFDVIPLADGKIGFVIADVMDKGIGPAIYMTLSRTLIRTYATEFDLLPHLVFFATNERILRDTQANLFVTAFFGVLDPLTGHLSYCNAGHNPPFLLTQKNDNKPLSLTKTGIPIGIDIDATWELSSAQLDAGDVLVLFTDGVPDAQNNEGEFFKEETLVAAAKGNLGQSAEALQGSILNAVYDFVGDAPQFDDITLMILARDKKLDQESMTSV